jgi:uncharacterized protein
MRGAVGGRLLRAVVIGLVLVTSACSGGSDDDAAGGLDEEFRSTPGERSMQIEGAGKLRLGATLAIPQGAQGAVPGVLIIPAPGDTDRNGPLIMRPPDKLYQELSGTLTAAGMATLRYDHRGIGESQLDRDQELTWDDMVGDAREALAFMAQRREIDGNRLAIVAHDAAGAIALKLAAADPKVKSVALISAPGRPLGEVWTDRWRGTYGQASADAFKVVLDRLLTTGSLPPRSEVPPEFQSVLPPGRDGFFKGLFSMDPLADAAAVKVPVLVVIGERSVSVTQADASRLTAALGGRSEVVVAPNSSTTLQHVLPTPVRAFDPNNHDLHGLGPPVADAPRDTGTMTKIVTFVATAVGAAA